METNFHWIDGIIIIAYLVTLTGIGVYFSKRHKGLEDFFLAGQSMAWLPVGLSLMAALNSGIDYLMQPSATIKYGLILLLGTTSWLMLYPWVAKVTLPFYRRLNFITAYEYLEDRFDVRVRTLAASIFILWRLGWLGTAMYVPCLAVSAVTDERLLIPMIVVLGSIVTLYTMLGGIKAVIWTDVIQFCIMLGGLAATVAIVTANVPGGVAEIWQTAHATGKTSLSIPIAGMANAGFFEKLHLFFKEPITIVGLLAATMVGRMTVYTCDQVMVQRFQTTRSVRDSRQAFVINAVGDAIWMIGLAFVGLALFAYFQHHSLPEDFKSDKILPCFMSQAFPAGAVGLVIAAIFAASLSSIDSAINSCTSVAVVDFYNRLFLRRQSQGEAFPEEEQRGQIRVSRIATLAFGVIGIVLASNVGRIGDLIEICNKVIQSFTGPLFGIYLLGMFSLRASSGGVLIGGLVGAAVSLYVAFFSGLSFLWPSAFALLATLIVGYTLSLCERPPAPNQVELTFRRVMNRPELMTEQAD
ncbi:MAG: sodium/solute symporter [Armatimonadetes bacterium]|nr:sodium/solute symporter [Armatimonadota bacterium]